MNQFLVTLSSFIGHTGKMGISLLTVLAHHTAVIIRILPQEALRVVVAVNIDLGQGIVGCRFLTAFMNTSLQPRQQQLQTGERCTSLICILMLSEYNLFAAMLLNLFPFFLPIPFLNFRNQFIR